MSAARSGQNGEETVTGPDSVLYFIRFGFSLVWGDFLCHKRSYFAREVRLPTGRGPLPRLKRAIRRRIPRRPQNKQCDLRNLSPRKVLLVRRLVHLFIRDIGNSIQTGEFSRVYFRALGARSLSMKFWWGCFKAKGVRSV